MRRWELDATRRRGASWTGSRRRKGLSASVALAVAAVAFGLGASPAEASQEVRGHILLASPGGNELTRRAWLASDGKVNGVTGFAFAVDRQTLGGSFRLYSIPGISGAEDVAIAFYELDGLTCGFYQNPGDESGSPCGAYAVAWIPQGATGSFIYRAEPSGSTTTTSTPTSTTTSPPPPPPLKTDGLVTAIPDSEAVTYQLNPQHSGGVDDGASASQHLTEQWRVNLGYSASYPLIAQGRVFTTYHPASDSYGNRLVAIDAQTGSILWDRFLGGIYFWSGVAYENGRVFAINYDGLLQAFDAASGTQLWSAQMPQQWAFSSEPSVRNGTVYVAGAGSGGTVYAVDAATGAVRWTASVANGDHSSPAVTATGTYVSYACNQAYDFDPNSGSQIWHHSTGCSGGGGRTTAVNNGRVYTREYPDNLVLDANTGAEVGTYQGALIPTFWDNLGFFVDSSGTLRAQDLDVGAPLWSFASDGAIATAPVVANGVVYAGTSSGHIDALDARTGELLWQGDTQRAISAPDEHNVSSPLSGISVGGRMLIVPASGTLVAYG